MMQSRRQFIRTALAAAAVPAVILPAWAQSYPTATVVLIVAAPPGGTADFLARLIGEWLSGRLGQQFIVENRPGASTAIGTDHVVNAEPDGHTLLIVSPANAINATLQKNLKHNFIRDIAPVVGLFRAPNVMVVHPSVPATTVPELVAYAKENPGAINYGSAGIGTSLHVTGELFKMMADIDMTHIPYEGTPQALSAVLSGEVQLVFDNISTSIDYIKGGRLRALAVTTAARSELLPELPTVGEFLPEFEASAFFGVGAPRDTPKEIVEVLNREINAGLADPGIRAQLATLAGPTLAGSSDDFGRLIADETEKWRKVIEFANIQAG